MSDGKGWIGSADHQGVRGLVARSANVIATAHDDLDQSSDDIAHIAGDRSKPKKRKPVVKLQSLEDEAPANPKSTDASSGSKPTKPLSSLERRLAAQPKPDAVRQDNTEKPAPRAASAHRRAVFRQFLRSRDIGEVRSLGTFESLKDFETQDRLDTKNGLDRQDRQRYGEEKNTEPHPKPARRRVIFRKRRAGMRAAEDNARDNITASDETARDARLLNDDLFDRHLEAFDRAGWDRSAHDRNDLEDDAEQQEAPWKGTRITHKPWQSDPEPEPEHRRSLFARWTQQLDSFSNAIVGLLIATLLAVSALGAGTYAPQKPAAPNVTGEDDHVRASPPAAHSTKTPHTPKQIRPMRAAAVDPIAALLAGTSLGAFEAPAPQALLPPGFDIHTKAFPKPLPAKPADISTMLSWARPARASAPGISVFPYTDLPQAVPSVPHDIAGHLFMATPQNAPAN